jgi:hypothetical protein
MASGVRQYFGRLRHSPFAACLSDRRGGRARENAWTAGNAPCARASRQNKGNFGLHRLAFSVSPNAYVLGSMKKSASVSSLAEDVIAPVAKRLLQTFERALDFGSA